MLIGGSFCERVHGLCDEVSLAYGYWPASVARILLNGYWPMLKV